MRDFLAWLRRRWKLLSCRRECRHEWMWFFPFDEGKWHRRCVKCHEERIIND